MNDVLLRFEREDREGVVAVGTYLIDAAKRLGVELTTVSEEDGSVIEEPVEITKGVDVLSPLTEEEAELILEDGIKGYRRIASYTRVEKPGEVVIMTAENKTKEKAAAETAEDVDYKKHFEELPLEKKLAQLVELEMIALGETFSFVLNSPYTVANKIMDVMSEFGLQKEVREKEATRPAEHRTAETADEAQTEKKAAAKKAKTNEKGVRKGKTNASEEAAKDTNGTD